MKKLEDLKNELLNNKLEKFYIFYGEDCGIRKHYIQKISSFFENEPEYLDSYNAIKVSGIVSSLFGADAQLAIIYNDEEFLKLNQDEIQKFINNLKDYTCIFVYETMDTNLKIFEWFGQYITYFPVVQNNIAQEFVKDEIQLAPTDIELFATNCGNNYNAILIESDKIKEYSESKNVSNQVAYDTLKIKNQLLEVIDEFDVNEFMNDILLHKTANYEYWYVVIQSDADKLYRALPIIFNDYLIAGLIKQYGKYDGSSAAYQCKLSWVRAKTIREFKLDYDCTYYYNCAYNVACLDADIKSGAITKDKLIDYFYAEII